MRTNKIILSCVFALSALLSNAQIIVTQTQTPTELVNNVLVGSGVVISNVKFNNSVPLANAIQTQVGYFNANATTFPLAEGVIMATGNAILAVGPNNSGSATNNTGVATDPNDPDLDAISTAPMNDEAVLEFDFVPDGDSVIFRYIFASEEYPEFSPSTYNDAFGFFISGPGFAGPYTGGAVNIAQLPSPIIPVTINNVNPTTNPTYYVSNPTGSTAIQYDGRTVVLTAAAEVQCGQTYHIKLAIADAGDWSWDSAVFLEASSFSSNGVQVQIASATGSAAITEACDSAIVTFIRPADQVDVPLTISYGIGGTATNGTDYPLLPGTITFPVGVDTVQFYITPSADGLTEGTETVVLTVTIINACGDPITTTATIEIVDPVPFTVVPGNVVLDCPVATTPITATASGGVGPFTYNWALGPTTPSINVPGNIPGVTSYNVSMTDACGSVQNGSVTVTLNAAPVPTINFNFDTQTICPNDDATFIASVVNPYNAGALTYNWTPAPGGTTNTITVSPNTLTWYYLTINDGCYNVTDSVKVDMGNVNISSVSVTDATNCPGQPGVLGQIQVFPSGLASYTLNGGGFVYGPQTSNTFTNLNGGVIYFLHVENANGCTKDTTIVVGLGSNAVTATWDLGALQDVTCGGDQNGAAAVTNIGGGITPPYTVTWTHTTGLFDDALVGVGGSDAINNLFGGNWVVTVTDQEGCAWSQLFNIFEPGVLTLDFISNNPSCYQFNDASVTASTTGGNGGNIFTMTNSAGTPLNTGNSNTINQLVEGWYYTTIVDSEGCTIEDSIFITQPGELAIDLTVIQPLCYGIPSGFAGVDTVYNYAGNYADLAYFWAPNPSGINGVGALFTNHMGPGNYALTINDGNGCSKVFDFTIAYPPELVFTEIGYHPAYCRLYSYQSGNGVVYAAAGGGTPDYSYLWTNNQTGVTTTNTTWGGRNPGSYTISVIDNNGCTLTGTVQLDSLNPIAEFDVTSAEFLTPGVYEGTAVVNVTFTNQSLYFANPFNPTADTTFFWNLDTANNPTWQITHDYLQEYDTSYAHSGIYTVCLVAINKNGCKDTTCKDMIIYDPLTFVPINIFTPNGDGVNDGFTFYDRSIAVETFEAVIVNRWGVVLFEMNDITDVWYGTDKNGDKVSDGLYFYTYEGAATNGEEFKGQGTITIVDSE